MYNLVNRKPMSQSFAAVLLRRYTHLGEHRVHRRLLTLGNTIGVAFCSASSVVMI